MSLLGASKRKFVFNKEEVEFFSATTPLRPGRPSARPTGGQRPLCVREVPGSIPGTAHL
jgi:hypothetical protein